MVGKKKTSAAASEVMVPGPGAELSIADLGTAPAEVPRVDRVWVRVEVSHNGLYAGQLHEMVLSQRVQALIDVGYLEVVLPPDGVWPV